MTDTVQLISNDHLPAVGGTEVVYFTASWCGPCRQFSTIFQTVSAQTPDVAFHKVDIDVNPALAANNSIMGVPTILLRRNGLTVGSRSGPMSAARLTEWIATHTR